MVLLTNTRLCAVAVAVAGLFSQDAAALDCIRGGISNTTAVRKTYPVPPISIYPLIGDFFSTAWSTLYSFNYSGQTHPPTPANATSPTPPTARRTLIFNGYTFDEQLLYINDADPDNTFELRWNMTNPPNTKPNSPLILDGYVQDMKVSHACNGLAALLEWTIEYCSSDQLLGWNLFQNVTDIEANALAEALNIEGASDGSWDHGCAIPVSSTEIPMPTTTGIDGPTDTAATTTTSSAQHEATQNGAMETAMPRYGGALALAMAAAVMW